MLSLGLHVVHRFKRLMTNTISIIVFSDLDGTLIDHDTYRWDAATPALDALKHIGAGIVLASSKTAAEIAVLQDELGVTNWPAIVENGAGLILPGNHEQADNSHYQSIRRKLEKIPDSLRKHFRGFGDMHVSELVKVTGLSVEFASLARQRNYSEPGLWNGTDAKLSEFLAALSKHNISARSGGRFLTLSYGQTKADRMKEVIKQYQPFHTVALGDAPNDVEMLHCADIGVVVANPSGKPMPAIENGLHGRIIRTTLPGPVGWNRVMLDIIAELGLD